MPYTVRRRSGPLTLVVAGLVLVTPLLAGAQEDLDAERRQVQAQQAGVAADIDATRATDQQVSAALTAAGQEVEAQQARVADTERAASDAEAALASARDEVARTQAEADRAAAQLREAAVDGYVRPPDAERMDRLFTSEPGRGEVRDALARSAVRSTTDALDRLRAAREDLARAEAAADQAELEARGQHAEAELRLVELDVARSAQADLVEDIATRLDALLGEAAALASRDAALAAEITRRQAELAAQVAASQAAAAAQAATPEVTVSRSSGDIALANVRGIEVAAEIGDQLAAMLAAADADGVHLEGGGWRSPDEQIAIRMEVCGTSDYAIWDMPSWECSPPVARPGRSMHERGLAIDFTADGDLIRSRSNPAFVWLSENAERFGFFNLPSEPWHWSTTGS